MGSRLARSWGAASRHLLLVVLGLVLSTMACAAPGGPGYYTYLLYLKEGDAARAVAEAKRQAAPLLRHHRLLDATARGPWQRQGAIPIAFIARSIAASTLDAEPVSLTHGPVRDLLGTRPGTPGAAVEIRIGYPQALDIDAYVEALEVTLRTAQALDAPAILDGETGDLVHTDGFARRLTAGRHGGDERISVSNPPALTLMEGMTSLHALPNGGNRTRGLGKVGLPDLVVDEAIDDFDYFGVFEIVSRLLMAHRISPTPGTTFDVAAADPVLAGLFDDAAAPGGVARLGFAPLSAGESAAVPGLLHLAFPGPPNLHVYERQALFRDALEGPRYRSSLGRAENQQIALAVARAKSRIAGLRGRFASLRQQGSRVFMLTRLALTLQDLAALRKEDGGFQWREIVAWREDGTMAVRRWQGDPRHGGHPIEDTGGAAASDIANRYQDNNVHASAIEDLLIVDADGRFSGAEVADLVRGYALAMSIGSR